MTEVQDDEIDAVVALGNRYTKRLGLLTPLAYRQIAKDGGLLAAVDGDELVGYALFGLPKRRPYVRLTHLCVAEERRGSGAARLLVEAIQERHGQRLGMRAKCRRDYGLSPMWTSLGFVPRGEVRGRGSDGETLDGWWLDFGHPDLFSTMESEEQLAVAVDFGVFVDLRGQNPAPGAEQSRGLEAGWLADLVELAFTPQLHRDLQGVVDNVARGRLRAAAEGFRQVQPETAAVATCERNLLSRTQALANAGADADGPDVQRCLRYIAEASSAGLQVLVSRDPQMLGLADVAWEGASVRVIRPEAIALQVDELQQAQTYQPVGLLGTGFRTAEVQTGSEDGLVALFKQSGEDNGPAFASRLGALADGAVRWQREAIRDGEGSITAVYAWALVGQVLMVPVLRTAVHVLEDTLARQLLYLLRLEARRHGARAVHITDGGVSSAVRRAAGPDGFFEHSEGLAALIVDVCGSAEDVSRGAAEAAHALGSVSPPGFSKGLSAEVTSMLERCWWPAKVMDSRLPSFVVPIDPRWSTDLFSYPAMMLTRSDELGISREHVYYRSAGHRGESVPGRLLWYVSAGKRGREGQVVIGSSRLDEVVIDQPDALFERFQHLGVYGREQVRATAEPSGRAMALRFSDTEIFPEPVGLRRFESLAQGLGLPLSLMSLTKISDQLFQRVYEEGHRTT